MQKKLAVIMIFLLLLIAGCHIDPSNPYSFRQEFSEISSIEILLQNDTYSSWDERFSLLLTLEASKHNDFVSDLSEIKGQPFFNPPPTSFDKYVIRITYKNGEEEYISRDNNGYKTPGSKLCLDTYWFSDKEGFYKLLSEYSGLEIK